MITERKTWGSTHSETSSYVNPAAAGDGVGRVTEGPVWGDGVSVASGELAAAGAGALYRSQGVGAWRLRRSSAAGTAGPSRGCDIELIESLRFGPPASRTDLDVAIALTRLLHHDFVSHGTDGKGRHLDDENVPVVIKAHRAVLERLALKPPT